MKQKTKFLVVFKCCGDVEYLITENFKEATKKMEEGYHGGKVGEPKMFRIEGNVELVKTDFRMIPIKKVITEHTPKLVLG